ncbi:hypothetical protein C8J57DRAFT_1332938 [Mycena rebaudengoi]|nr:hypothetical protein C8J57DRAFT_1332938 [Mycena rebaudengoi]
MPLTLPDPLPSIELSHGPSFVGIVVGCMLYGAVFVQVFTYYGRFPNDRLWTKLYVGLLLLTDTVGTILAIAWLYNLTMINFRKHTAYGAANWNPGIVGITGALCQLFYAWRIHVLTKQPMLTAVIVTVSLVGAIAAIGVSGTVGVVKLLSRFHARGMKIFGATWLVSALASDITISFVLTWYLRRRRSGFSEDTDRLLNRIIAITLANGALTSIFALVELCFFLGQPETGLHIGFSWILGKLYTNSVMASLNLRKQNRGYSENNTTSAPNVPGTRRDGGSNVHRLDPNVVVHVSTEHHELSDAPSYGWDTDKRAARPAGKDDNDIYSV